MANELEFLHRVKGLTTIYAILSRGANIMAHSNGAFTSTPVRNAANWASGAIAMSDAQSTYRYLGNLPTGLGSDQSGRWYWEGRLQGGGSPSPDDAIVSKLSPIFIGTTGAEIEGVNANVTLLNSSVFTPGLTGPLQPVNTIQTDHRTLVRGDSYRNDTGTALLFSKASGALWPTDLTTGGYTIKLTAKPTAETLKANPAAPVLVVASGGSIISATQVRIGDIAGGTTNNDANTGTLHPGPSSYQFDVLAEKAGPIRHRLCVGTFSIVQPQT